MTRDNLDTASPVVLHVDRLNVLYHKGGKEIRAVHDFSLDVSAGERIGIIGESGSGKSTVTHALLGILPRNATVHAHTGHLDNVDLFSGLSDKGWNQLRRKSISYIPQDPNIALDAVLTVGKQLNDAVRTADPSLTNDQITARSLELLERVGIHDPERAHRSYPHQLSGGQRQRVLIAIAVAGDPKVIIADEPTSGLDVSVQKRVLDLIDEIVHQTKAALILITHDLAVAAQRTDRLTILQHGVIVESGPTQSVINSPKTAYGQALRAAVPEIRLQKLPPSHPGLKVEHSDATASGDIAVGSIFKTYITRDKRTGKSTLRANHDVSLHIVQGTTYGLVGESGSGKSTLARIVAGIEQPDSGSVTFGENPLSGAGSRRVRQATRRDVQYVFQNPYESLNPKQTVQQILLEPLEGRRISLSRAEATQRVQSALDTVGIPSTNAARRPTELSGGQRQRIAIARALITKPRFIVMDEPVSALDVSVQAQIVQLLIDLQNEFRLTYLFISHDLAVVSQLADYIGVLEHGQLIEQGTPEQIFTQAKTDYTKKLLEAIPRLEEPALV